MTEKEREIEHRRKSEIETVPESIPPMRREAEIITSHKEEDYKGSGDELKDYSTGDS